MKPALFSAFSFLMLASACSDDTASPTLQPGLEPVSGSFRLESHFNARTGEVKPDGKTYYVIEGDGSVRMFERVDEAEGEENRPAYVKIFDGEIRHAGGSRYEIRNGSRIDRIDLVPAGGGLELRYRYTADGQSYTDITELRRVSYTPYEQLEIVSQPRQ